MRNCGADDQLRYDWVARLCRRFPQLRFELNGGLKSLDDVAAASTATGGGPKLSGYMIGRAAYNDSWNTLSCADTEIFGEERNPATCRRQVISDYLDYAEDYCRKNTSSAALHRDLQETLCQPLLGLFSKTEAEAWRPALLRGIEKMQTADVPKSGPEGSIPLAMRRITEEAMALLPDELLDAPPEAGPVICCT